MKIDWKKVSKSSGYRSLKAAYIYDLQKGNRSKRELLQLFNWVINRAKHYAHKNNTTIEVILNQWESQRDYWWLNFYGEARQPKLGSNQFKYNEFKWIKKAYKHDRKARKRRMLSCLRHQAEKNSNKSPKRWSMDRKRRAVRYRNL